MTAGLLADLVVVLHLAFVAFVLFGALLALRWRHIVWLHLPAAAWGVYVEFSGRICPLTPLENRLRAAAGEDGYTGSFVEAYLLPVLYPAGLTPDIQMLLGALVVLVNVALYGFLWLRGRGSP
ncbi:MAG: DUF2784 domain-containing protein [Pseudomonadota bacterium]